MMACLGLALDDAVSIVLMEPLDWMRWVAGWVTASIGCWTKTTTGGNRPNLPRAGTAHGRHRAHLCRPGRRLPVEWSGQWLMAASVLSRPFRDGSLCSHHRQQWSLHQGWSPIPLIQSPSSWMMPGRTMTVSAWIAGSARGADHRVQRRLTLRLRLPHAPLLGDRCRAPAVAATDRLLAQLVCLQQPPPTSWWGDPPRWKKPRRCALTHPTPG